MDYTLRAYIWARTLPTALRRDEAGEGVISTAIAVLIMAALGAAMWVGFQALWNNTNERTTNQVNTIGGGGGAP
ncbi:MAG: hypothetical protein M3163_07825 [Actinomycetota bacterium]|jgi:hypothetical protein|nr:hypothetical protein [Actinomycetota bacterium]